jgi:hypothetical protein
VGNEWQVHIDRPVDHMAVRVYIFRDVGNTHGGTCREFVVDLAKGMIQSYDMAPGTLLKKDVQPAILLDFKFATAILEPLVRALIQDGISVVDKKETTADELKSTNYHLEDMREIVSHFLKPREGSSLNKRKTDDPGF